MSDRRDHSGPIAALGFAAAYGLGFGASLVAVGPFVGPVSLVAGIVHVAVGLGSAAIASGLRADRRWAVPAGRLPSLAVAPAGWVIGLLAAAEREWPAVIGSALAAALFTAVAREMFRRA